MSTKRKTSPAPVEAPVAPVVVDEPKKKHKKSKNPEEAEVAAPSPVVEEEAPAKKKKKQAAGEPAPVAPPSPNPKKAESDKKKNGAAAATVGAAAAAAAPTPVAPAAAPAKVKSPKAKPAAPPASGPTIVMPTSLPMAAKAPLPQQSQVVVITQPKAGPKIPAPPVASPSPMITLITEPKKGSKPVVSPAPAVASPSALTGATLQPVTNPALMAALGIPSSGFPGGFLPQFFLASNSDMLNSQIKKRKRPEVNPQEMFTDTLNAFTAAMTQLAALLPRSYSNTSAMNDMAKVYDNAINTLHAQRQKLSTKPPKVKIDDKGNVEEDDSRGHRWTDEDTIKMMEMKTNGQTNRAVALALGRSTAAVSQRYKLVKAGKVACPGFDPVAAKAKAAATAAVAAITGPPLKPTGAAADDDEEDETDEEDEDDEDEEEHTSHLGNIVASRFGPLSGSKAKADDDE